jgi:hypothetical protein
MQGKPKQDVTNMKCCSMVKNHLSFLGLLWLGKPTIPSPYFWRFKSYRVYVLVTPFDFPICVSYTLRFSYSGKISEYSIIISRKHHDDFIFFS